jgi:peptidyl-prolyl cis-trans isomerase C
MQISPRAALLLPLFFTSCGAAEPASSDEPQAQAGRAAVEAPPASPEGPLTPPPAPADPAAVLATVDGTPITAGEVGVAARAQIAQQARGAQIPEEQLALFEASISEQVLEELIDARVLDAEVERAGIVVPPEAVRAEVERTFDAYLLQANLTREDFEERVQSLEGISVDELLDREAENPEALRRMRQYELICQRHPEETAVSDVSVAEAYERDREQAFTRPEMVRASHVLIEAPAHGGGTPEERAALRAQAEEVVVLARTADVAFAELARERSACPSSQSGGDLGFFPREGVMDDTFAAAAFALEPGQISDVVETDFGYHVIQCTERSPASVLTLESVAPMIRSSLRMQKIEELRRPLVASLRSKAEIAYAGDGSTGAPAEGE